MNLHTYRCLAFGAMLAIITSRGHVSADNPAPTKNGQADIKNLPTAAQIKELVAHPKEFKLKGADETRQLIVTGALERGMQDLTGEVTYQVGDEKILGVTPSGRVFPLANG